KVFAIGPAHAAVQVVPPPLAQPVTPAAASPPVAAPVPSEDDPFATAPATAPTQLRKKAPRSRQPLILAAAGAAAVLLLAIGAIVSGPATREGNRAKAAPKKDATSKPAQKNPTAPATPSSKATYRPEPLKKPKNIVPDKEEPKNFDDWKQDF